MSNNIELGNNVEEFVANLREGGFCLDDILAMFEDEEFLDGLDLSETSKEKLRHYVSVASIDKSNHAHEIGFQNALGVANGRPRDAKFHRAQKLHARRSGGIQTAVAKLAKESEENPMSIIQEISKKLAKSYFHKAKVDKEVQDFGRGHHGAEACRKRIRGDKEGAASDEKARKTADHKSTRRSRGMNRAVDRLMKNEAKEGQVVANIQEKVGPGLAALRARRGGGGESSEKKEAPSGWGGVGRKAPASTIHHTPAKSSGGNHDIGGRISNWQKANKEKSEKASEHKEKDTHARKEMAHKMAAYGRAEERAKIARGMSKSGKEAKPFRKDPDKVASGMSTKPAAKKKRWFSRESVEILEKKAFNPGGHKGKLHREIGVPEGKKIPEKKLEKAEHSKNKTVRNDAIRAETMKGWNHHRKESVEPVMSVTEAKMYSNLLLGKLLWGSVSSTLVEAANRALKRRPIEERALLLEAIYNDQQEFAKLVSGR